MSMELSVGRALAQDRHKNSYLVRLSLFSLRDPARVVVAAVHFMPELEAENGTRSLLPSFWRLIDCVHADTKRMSRTQQLQEKVTTLQDRVHELEYETNDRDTNDPKYTSDVITEFGRPIPDDDLEPFFNETEGSPRASVKSLARTLENERVEVTVNAPDWDTLDAARMARDRCKVFLLLVDVLSTPEATMAAIGWYLFGVLGETMEL
ncbi:hypothetical protein BDZ89DRAFT_1132021 [Hymenopellis radicata]|nr:hypothetical protein BDZ89DRAFT_1132021 [Hymenopellis radicata]